ncbi:class A beta-lactamase [Phenylobacterium sp.]|uniref:class A beta-lactamase n=1 Tax=Phenylobacterium sp. TaxID=1871053 RepID=UPI0025E9CC50|nr:class A beta-lactamase [Phenylobacterium sp.]
MASLHRRALMAAAPAALVAACEPGMPTTVSTTPKIALAQLTDAVTAIAERAKPGILGVGLANLESGQAFFLDGERRFPMQSVFKLPLAAAVLSEVDAGRVLLTERIFLLEQQLSPPHSPIAAAWPQRREYSARELLEAMVVDGDNTAADVLMKRIGGPGAVTAWLTARRVPEVRVDRYERELASDALGMAPYRPAWRAPGAFSAALAAVPPERRAAAQARYMTDPRDTATPRGMIEFLQMFDSQQLISPNSTRLLLQMMARTSRGTARLRAGLPAGVFLAHRAGAAAFDLGRSAAHNDVGIFTLPDKRAYALAVFLSGSTLDEAGRDRVIAQVAAAALKAVG